VDPATGQRPKNKGRESRSALTSNGRVSLRRRRDQGAVGGSRTLVDALLDAAEATVSLGARELCCRTGIDCKSFARAAAQLKHVGQLLISASSLRAMVEIEGKRSLLASDSGALKVNWQAADCRVKTPGDKEVSRVYVGIDGFMTPQITEPEKRKRRQQVVTARARRPRNKPKLPPLPRRKKGADQRYKEFKLVQFHDEAVERRLISVTRKPCAEAGRIMRRDARRIGFEKADEKIANVDGGPWIVNLLMRWAVVLSALCLDFYHLGQQVNQAKRVSFGENNPAGEQWAGQLMHAVKHQGYEPFWDQLLDWRRTLRRGRKRTEADRLLNYVATRKEMILYDQCRRNGWRISSSTTESECGAVPARVKGPGKRWDADNAEAVIALEAIHQSNLWQTYWTTAACQNN
jgi:hypothetical protein